MIIKYIDLYEYFKIARPKGASGYLKITCHTETSETPLKLRPATLIVPGGGYEFVSQREDEPVALKFLAQGYNCFSLDYTVKVLGYPTQLLEIAMAMVFIRKNAKEYCVDENSVCAVGFSAGGHLVGSLATRFNDEKVLSMLNVSGDFIKPNAVILSYSVLDFYVDDMKHPTRKIVTNGDEKELIEYLDVASNVSKSCPPAFIWATKEGELVDASASLKFALQYQKLGLVYELHIFEKGWHGLSVADEEVNYDDKGNGLVFDCSLWVDLAVKFLKNHGFRLKYIK